MAERGSTKNGAELDDQLRHETQGLVQGQGGTGHVEEDRQAESLPDDTDPAEVRAASGVSGDLVDDATPSAADAPLAGDADDTLSEGAAGPTADPVVHSTETAGADADDATGGSGTTDGGGAR